MPEEGVEPSSSPRYISTPLGSDMTRHMTRPSLWGEDMGSKFHRTDAAKTEPRPRRCSQPPTAAGYASGMNTVPAYCPH